MGGWKIFGKLMLGGYDKREGGGVGEVENKRHGLVKEISQTNTSTHMQFAFLNYSLHFFMRFLSAVRCSELIL